MSYNNNMKSWGPELCGRRPGITTAMVDAFLTNMYTGARADFIYSVTREVVRNCQTPILVLPDDVPVHPYAVAMGKPCILRPTRRSASIRGRTHRTRFRWRCAKLAPSFGHIDRWAWRNRWLRPSSAFHFSWPRLRPLCVDPKFEDSVFGSGSTTVMRASLCGRAIPGYSD